MKTFLAAIAPILGTWVAKVVVWPRPFWVHFYDPEAIHFYAGLHLLRGLVPENVDNPGTPLQLISALIAAVTGATPARYEAFLFAAHGVELLLAIAGAAILFFGVLEGAPPLARVAAVWLYFCAPQAFERLDVWSPEVLYLPLGAATLLFVRRWSHDLRLRTALLAGLFAGLAAAAKFVFLPWIAALGITLLLQRRVGHAAMAGLGGALGFLLGTLPVVRAYDLMFHRLLFLSSAAHSDTTWSALLLSAKAWLVCALLVGLAVVMCIRREEKALAIFSCLVIALAVLSSARNPAFRYLLPVSIALAGLFATAAVSPKFTRAWQIAAAIAIAAVMLRAIQLDLGAHRRRIADAANTRDAIRRLVPNDAVVVYGWRAPVPSFALRIETRDPRYHAAVAGLYPREGHLSPWTHRLYLPPNASTWSYAVVSPNDAAFLPDRFAVIGRAGPFVVLRRLVS